jgi:AraC-like DNA-binding protein
MQVRRFQPAPALAPFIRCFTIVESTEEATRTLIPDGNLTLGVRYRGYATQLDAGGIRLVGATLAGIQARARVMRTAPDSGVVLAMFHPGAAARWFRQPLHELFGTTIDLELLLRRSEVERLREQVLEADDDAGRVAALQRYLLASRASSEPDLLAERAAAAITAARGAVRISALADELGIGQDRLEKRFRRTVGASPKQLASMVRVRHAIDSYRPGTTMARLSADSGYFDQSHFNREVRAVTGRAPTELFEAGDHC